MESLRQAVEALSIKHEMQQLARVTISAGVAAYPLHGLERETLIQVADQALYTSKRTGRNRVTLAPVTGGLMHVLKAAAPDRDLSAHDVSAA